MPLSLFHPRPIFLMTKNFEERMRGCNLRKMGIREEDTISTQRNDVDICWKIYWVSHSFKDLQGPPNNDITFSLSKKTNTFPRSLQDW